MTVAFSSRGEVWARFSQEIGGRWYPARSGRAEHIQVRHREWLLTFDVPAEHLLQGDYLRVRAPFVNWTGFRFTLATANIWHRAAARLGCAGVDHPPLDRYFRLLSDDPTGLGEYLADTDLCSLLLSLRPHLVAVTDDEGWSGPSYPRGVDVLTLRVPGPVEGLHPLRRSYMLLLRLIEGLDRLQTVQLDPVEHATLLLGAPSGVVQDLDIRLWDGEVLRAYAAERLGATGDARAAGPLIEALGDRHPGVRSAAVRALGELGNRAFIDVLIPLLADQSDVGPETVSEITAHTLRTLGAEPWVHRFLRVQGGRLDGSRLEGPHREAFVRALIGTVRGGPPQMTVDAARALVALRATEALPILRQAVVRHGFYLVGIAMDPLIRELESTAALPRPSSSPPPTPDLLPLPATPADSDSALLPRPVTTKDEG